MDWIVAVFLGCVVYSFLLFGGDLLGGEVGLAISNCIILTGMLQVLIGFVIISILHCIMPVGCETISRGGEPDDKC